MKNSVLQHWRHPYHRMKPDSFDLHGSSVSPACGDEIDLFLVVRDGVITCAYFEGDGCTICLGMASLTTQCLTGKTIKAATLLTESDILSLAVGVDIECNRHGCALVAYQALQLALR